MESLLFLGLLFVAMYVLLIRPQQQRVKAQRELLGNLGVGDDVITVGGLMGTIEAIDGETVHLRVADGTVLRFVRPAISRRAPAPGAPDAATPDES